MYTHIYRPFLFLSQALASVSRIYMYMYTPTYIYTHRPFPLLTDGRDLRPLCHSQR